MKYLKSFINLIFFVAIYIGFTRPYVMVMQNYYEVIYPIDILDFWISFVSQLICMCIIYRILYKFRKHIMPFKDAKTKNTDRISKSEYPA